MESILNSIWLQVTQYISVSYMLAVILISYFVKKNLGEVLWIVTRVRWKPVYTVLIIATSLAVPYLIFTSEGWQKILLSYAMATTLYETIFEWLETRILNSKPINNEEVPNRRSRPPTITSGSNG